VATGAEHYTRGLITDSADVRADADDPPRSGWREVDRLGVLPSLAHPHLLVPLRSRRAASASFLRFANGLSPRGRLAATALAVGMRAGAARPLLRSRLTLSVREGTPPERLSDLVLRHRLQEIFGREDLELAVRVGALRPNGKPVVQALTRSGEVLAFVKVGWNDLTRLLVRREAAALEGIARRSPPPVEFDVPRLLWAGPWHEYELVVVAPVNGTRGYSWRTHMEPPPAATREVATWAGVSRGALEASGWWQDAVERARGNARLTAALERIGRAHGTTELAFGSCHGDWSPWNMQVRHGRLFVWDWERSRPDVPVGLDVGHYLLLVALQLKRRDVRAAAAHALERAPGALETLDVPGGRARLLLGLTTLEMALRFEEARRAGVFLTHDLFADALDVVLEFGLG
jgi:hypothetical protein